MNFRSFLFLAHQILLFKVKAILFLEDIYRLEDEDEIMSKFWKSLSTKSSAFDHFSNWGCLIVLGCMKTL